MSNIAERKEVLELEREAFELEQRRAKMLSVSAFFPRELKNDIASAMIVHELANRMNISVLEVAQNIYIIHGKPAFSTSFLVARLNTSGLIKGALKTIVSDDKQSAYCEAVDKETGETLRGMTITMDIARAEGWLSKGGSKWRTLPELMLRKRAQAFFIREFYPQVTFGLHTEDEIRDAEVVNEENVDINETVFKSKTVETEVVNEKEVVQEAEVVEAEEVTEEVKEEVKEEPKKKKIVAPRYITSRYEKMIELGAENENDCRKMVRDFGWFDKESNTFVDQSIVEEAFSNEEELRARIRSWYGLDEKKEVVENKDYKVSILVANKYPNFINAGLKVEDCRKFAEHYNLTADNIDEFMTILEDKIKEYYDVPI